MNPATKEMERVKILIVDDEQTNIIVLGNLLKDSHYDLMVSSSGREALELIQQTTSRPDLILLDVMMPEMDGYQVCTALQTIPHCEDIPVVFITALDGEPDIIRGLELGAIDYITKPFSPLIVHTKIRNIIHQLEIKKELEIKVERELIQNERMSSLGQMVAGFTHDLASPLSVSRGAVSYLSEAIAALRTLLEQDEISEEEVFDKLDKLDESARLAEGNLTHAESMTGSFKRVSIDQTSEARRNFQLQQLLEDVATSLSNTFKRSQVVLNIDCPPSISLFGTPGALTQVITNLINNSWRHAFDGGRASGSIQISVQQRSGEEIEIVYRDDGAGMSEETRKRVFERFYTTSREQGGSGIGMHNAYQLITQQMGGTIRVESSPSKGAKFTITLPLNYQG